MLEDLNNDFQLETITVGGDFNPSNRFAYVFAWKPDGQQASGFPIQVQDNNSMSGTFNLTRVIAGDLMAMGQGSPGVRRAHFYNLRLAVV